MTIGSHHRREVLTFSRRVVDSVRLRVSKRRNNARRRVVQVEGAPISRGLRIGDRWPWIEQGRGTYGWYTVTWHEGDPDAWVRIGNYSSIAVGVEFMIGGNHRYDWVSTFPFRIVDGLPRAYEDGMPWTKGDITVGSDVWIGRDALILSGVTIGHGAVVGTRAVVTRDIRPYAVVAGNPASEVRRRFSDAVVDELLATQWWHWPHDELIANVDLMNGGSPEELIAYAARRRPDQRPDRASSDGPPYA